MSESSSRVGQTSSSVRLAGQTFSRVRVLPGETSA